MSKSTIPSSNNEYRLGNAGNLIIHRGQGIGIWETSFYDGILDTELSINHSYPMAWYFNLFGKQTNAFAFEIAITTHICHDSYKNAAIVFDFVDSENYQAVQWKEGFAAWFHKSAKGGTLETLGEPYYLMTGRQSSSGGGVMG